MSTITMYAILNAVQFMSSVLKKQKLEYKHHYCGSVQPVYCCQSDKFIFTTENFLRVYTKNCMWRRWFLLSPFALVSVSVNVANLFRMKPNKKIRIPNRNASRKVNFFWEREMNSLNKFFFHYVHSRVVCTLKCGSTICNLTTLDWLCFFRF